LPQVNPATVVLVLLAASVGAWAAGLLRLRYEDGRLGLQLWRGGRLGTTFDLRDAWLLLGLTLAMGWSGAAAVERSAWVPGTDGRLIPALALATLAGWVLVAARLSRRAYLVATIPATVIGLVLFTPSPILTSGSLAAIRKWLFDLPDQSNLLQLMGLLLMFIAAGLWSSWWVFMRRNGLVALLPTGTVLTVEILNDTSPGLYFFTILWLATAAAVLLRLNFVARKQGWRSRRLPHATDTGWTFGEVGIEATVGILAIAFILLPPLSTADTSALLIPGTIHTDSFHPFGLGTSSKPGSVGSVGYSEVVRPGSQLKAKSQTIMVVSGDTPTYYPYWRGIALAGWDGITWYALPSTREVPVRQQPLLASKATVPRDDLPTDGQRIQVLHNTFRVVVPMDQTLATVFSGGEIISVENQPTTLRGIMTSVPAPQAGPIPALVNVAGDSTGSIATFDTIDRVRFARRLTPVYAYSLTEAIPNVVVTDLRNAGTEYPAWVAPFQALYEGGRIAQGYSPARDAEISRLAQSIVREAGAITPYDQAKAIESWFLAKGRFTYTLTPPVAPTGVRPLDYFLFTSHKGYCQDFSTAMNVMLRTLNVPSRQMSGFGQGVFDDKSRQYNVNALDAHSWVEVFFPGYGWIPFEATPDGINAPVNRPLTQQDLNASAAPTSEAAPRNRAELREPLGQEADSTSSTAFPDLWRPVLAVIGGLLLLAIIALLLGLRWLLAVRDVPRIWRRLLFLGDRLKVPRHSGDTPQEFGGRLAASVPIVDADVRRLSMLYTRASFRQGGLTGAELADARQAWARIRRSYPGLVARAWRDALRQGRVVSAEEVAASESPEPSRPR
jgi:transglutaminase-like putative cysteine protease